MRGWQSGAINIQRHTIYFTSQNRKSRYFAIKHPIWWNIYVWYACSKGDNKIKTFLWWKNDERMKVAHGVVILFEFEGVCGDGAVCYFCCCIWRYVLADRENNQIELR